MRNLLCIVFILLTVLSSTFGQRTARVDTTRNIYLGFRISIDQLTMEDFNQTLNENQFNRLEEQNFSYEFYMRTRMSNLFDGNLTFGYRERKPQSNSFPNRASMTGYYMGFEGGKDLIKHSALTIRPYLGFNLEYNRIVFVENLDISSLEGILNTDFKTYALSSVDFPFVFGLELGTAFKVSKHAALELNIYGGYRLYLKDNNWNINDGLPFNDSIKKSTPFLGLGIGYTSF